MVFLEILVWLSTGWLFNRMLSLLFWDTLIKKISNTTPPLLLVQLSGIFVLILTVSCIAHFVFDEPLTTIVAAAGGLGFCSGLCNSRADFGSFFWSGDPNGSPFQGG